MQGAKRHPRTQRETERGTKNERETERKCERGRGRDGSGSVDNRRGWW